MRGRRQLEKEGEQSGTSKRSAGIRSEGRRGEIQGKKIKHRRGPRGGYSGLFRAEKKKGNWQPTEGRREKEEEKVPPIANHKAIEIKVEMGDCFQEGTFFS